MTHIKHRLGVSLVILLLSFLAGCVTPPTKEELAALDYGECPQNYEAKIKEHFQGGFLTWYSGDPIIWPPQQYWYKASPLEGGKLYAGYLVVVMADQKFGPPPTAGKQLYGLLFKNDQLVKTLDPMQMRSLNINEAVGPLPKDERNWKEGHSDSKAGQFVVEYVLPGETVQNWSELISLQIFRNVPLIMTPEELVAHIAESAKKEEPRCAIESRQILASTPTEVLYEATLANCAPMRDEYSIRKMLRGPRTITEVSYAKTTAMTDAEKKKWAEIVGRTKILGECQPNL